MGYEMEIRCDGCGDATPSLKMWRKCSDSTAAKLGVWIYEHIHCLEEFQTTQSETNGNDLPPLRFTRIVEDDELYGINRDLKWRYPITKRTLDYQELWSNPDSEQ